MEYVLMGNGKKNAKVMFIADFPSFEEYDNDKWFSDRPGKLLRSVLKEVGIDVKDCYFTGIVKKPTQEDAKGNQLEPGKAEVEEHMDIFLAELEVVNPKIIVPMGNVALKKTLGYTGITKFRGKGLEKDDKIIFPIVHPRLVFRQPKHAENFTRDIQNLADLVREGEKLLEQSDVNYRYLETYEEVEAEIERLNKEAEWLVFDLETTGLNPFRKGSKIVSISLTDKDHYGVSIPLEHRDFTWPKETLDKIIELLRNLFANKRTKKVAHNGKFDMKWLKAIYGIEVENFAFDPMLAHYIAVSEERGGHGLKELAWEHTDMGGYDNALDEYKKKHLPASERGNYDLIPWKILREYAAADVDCTFRLIKIFKPMIDANPKWKKMYDELFIEGSYALMDMECNGILATKERVEDFQRAYEERIAEIEERLREFPEIVQIEREKQKLFELRQKEMKKPKEERDPEILKYNKYKNFKFNFSSVVQLRELLFEKLGLDTPYLTDTAQKKGVKLEDATLNDFSTGKETLEYLKDKHPIASLLAEWKRLDKLYGTYIAPASDWIDTTDGRVHGTFNLTGTVTSRLASEAPNMQNIPRKSNDPTSFEYKYGPKKLFTSRFGEDGVILQFDYSQLELRVAAIFSNDEGLISAYRDGKDLHKFVASRVYGIPEEEVSDDQRTAAKAVGFGLLYGKGARSLAQDMGVSLEEAEEFIDAYFAEFPGMKRWIEETKKKVKKELYVETLAGFYRRLPGVTSNDKSIQADALRQSINAPIQGTGANMTMKSIILINKEFKKRKLKSCLAITVHDSIVADVYIPEISEVFYIMKNTMENLPFDWITVPIVSDAEVGRDYGSLVGFDDPSDFDEYGGVLNYIDVKLKENEEKLLEKMKK